MRITFAVVLAIFAANLYAAKPTDPEPTNGQGFVGYSEGTHQHGTTLTVEGAELCRDTFGDGATIAHLSELITAADDGTFVAASTTTVSGWAVAKTMEGIPSGTAIYYPSINALRSGLSNVIIHDNIQMGTLSSTGTYHIACVIR